MGFVRFNWSNYCLAVTYALGLNTGCVTIGLQSKCLKACQRPLDVPTVPLIAS